MLFPENARKVIADAFYDKTVEILDKTETVDDEGGVIKAGTVVRATFKGNVRFTALERVQDDLGLIERIDVAITCDTVTPVKIDDLLQYAGQKYVATEVLPRDSHTLVVGRKWR